MGWEKIVRIPLILNMLIAIHVSHKELAHHVMASKTDSPRTEVREE